MNDESEAGAPPYKYLVKRKHPWRRQLYIRGRNMTVRQLVGKVVANRMTYEEAAADQDLPVECIKEAFHYYVLNKGIIDQDSEFEQRGPDFTAAERDNNWFTDD